MSNRFRVVAVIVATLALLLTSCGSGEQQVADVPADGNRTETVDDNVATQQPGDQAQFGGTLTAMNQLGDGEQVVISRVTTDEATRALAVVYDDESGAPGQPVGHAEVQASAEGSLTVTLDEPLPEPGSYRLWIVLHVDADPVGEFEPGVDEPITTDGDPVRDDFYYTVTNS